MVAYRVFNDQECNLLPHFLIHIVDRLITYVCQTYVSICVYLIHKIFIKYYLVVSSVFDCTYLMLP